MSIFHPVGNWIRAPHGYERMWIGVALLWCLVLTIAMPYWHFKGQQTSSGEAYTVSVADYEQRVQRFVQTNQVGDRNGIPIVQAQPGGDAYMIGKNWQWYPALKLKKDMEYRIHLSSGDYGHGFSLQPMNMNFQVLPGYDHVITLKPVQTGEFSIICNEFCGAGHQVMTGLIIVED